MPTLLWLPLGAPRLREEGWLPADGHVFWGVKIDDRQGKILGNLKWRRDDESENSAFHNFVTQVFVAVAAEAAADRARLGSLVTAYPSVLPGWLRTQHQQEWEKVAERFGVQWRPARSESDAVVEYLVRKRQGKVRTNLLAVDIGGSTSDFAVWRREQPYLDSIQLAGSIFNRLLAKDAAAREAATAAARPVLGESFEWGDGEAEPRNAILAGLLLRKLGQAGPRGVRAFGQNLYAKGPGSPGERVLAHVAYLYAVVSFTLGMMTARHADEPDDNYNVYFAGRGAHLLTWVDAFGPEASQVLVTHFFRAGLSLGGQTDAPQVNVYVPENDAKEEVGRGLLLGLDRPTANGGRAAAQANLYGRTTFVGEECFGPTDAPLGWRDELSATVLQRLDEPARAVDLKDMRALQTFVTAFEADPLARLVADALGLERRLLDRNLRDLVHERIFGGAWQMARDRQAAKHLVLEPFFVTEAKALLEHVTGNALFEG